MFDALNKASSPWLQIILRHRAWILVGLTVLFVLLVRVRLRETPLERDEGEYAYAGQLLLHGLAPYKAAYTMKLPGTYAAYALIMAAFGQTPSGIHFGLALVNAASIVLVFLLGRKLLDDVAGVAAAIAFALLSLSPSVLGLAGHATHFVALAALSGILVLLRACEHPLRPSSSVIRHSNSRSAVGRLLDGYPLFFISGLLFGLAFLMKQHGLFFGLFGAVYLLWTRIGQWLTGELVEIPLPPRPPTNPSINPSIHQSTDPSILPSPNPPAPARRGVLIPARPGRLKQEFRPPGRFHLEVRRSLRDFGLFVLGWFLPYGLTCLLLWVAGALGPFFFWTISYAGKYASAIPLVSGADMLRGSLNAVVGPNLVLWVLPWVGALVMWWEKRLISRYRFLITLLLLCSFASVSVGLYFRGHYFIPLLPVLALLTGVAVSRGVHLLQHDDTIELFLALSILGLFVIALGASLIGNGAIWLGMTPAEAVRSVYGTTLFSEAAGVAELIKTNSAPDARVAVLGSEPEIYFYARRRGATGYLYMYPLMEHHDFALKMQQEMIAEIERAQPEFMVYVDDDFSWLPQPNSERKLFDWWPKYWATNLDLVATIEFEEGLERGADASNPARRSTASAPTRNHILVLKRRR